MPWRREVLERGRKFHLVSLGDSRIVFTFPDYKGCPKFSVITERLGKEGRLHQDQFAVNAVNASVLYAMPLSFV